MRRRVIQIAVAIPVAVATAYFGYIGVEASHRLVNQHTRNADCATPGSLGIEYEAINYAAEPEAHVRTGTDGTVECVVEGQPAGDAIRTADGVRIAGWYVPGSGIGPDGLTVVVAHGWTNNKSGVLETLDVFHGRANVVLLDFRNHGQSDAAQTTQGIHEQRDLVAVLDWLEAEKGPSTIVLWGQSMGGHTAANVAADDPRVAGLILDSTHSTLLVPMANRIERDGYPFGAVGAWAGVLGAWARTGVLVTSDDPIGAVADLGEKPLLIIHAGSDDTIPLEDAERLRDAAAGSGISATLEICADAEHAEIIETCPKDYQRWIDELLAAVGG